MAKYPIKVGTTSRRIKVRFRDTSVTTKNQGLTGLVHNSAGLTCYYHRDGDTSATAVTLVTATVGTWTSGGFKEIDATNMPGFYEFGIPNAALSSGNEVAIVFKGATNLEEYPVEIELTQTDNQDASAGGMSRLDASVTSRMATFTLPTNFSSLSINGSGHVVLADASLVTAKLGTFVLAKGTHISGFNDIAATSIVSGGAITTSGGEVSNVTTVGSVTNDVGGKILGGGAGTITGTGVRAVDGSGNAIAPASSIVSAAAIRTEMDTNSTKLANLDVAVSTRLATAGYTAPPSAATIATTVRDVDNTSPTAGSLGDKVNNAASAGDPWATVLPGAYAAGTAGNIIGNRVDVAVSSRMATFTYTTPPTVAAIRAEMDTNSTKLANLDATVSSRLATAGYTVPPTVTQIRTELDTNSTKLDVAVSTRLATASYTAAPTVSQIRTELDTNSTKLANLDVAVSTRLSTAGYTVPPTTSAISTAIWTDGSRSLTSAERLAIALAVRDYALAGAPVGSLGAGITTAASGGGGGGGGLSLTDVVTFRNQDAITAPTVEDCLAAAWMNENGKETTPSQGSTTTVTNGFVKYGPDKTTVMRAFTTKVEDSTGEIVERS